jgi:hypothetical protein
MLQPKIYVKDKNKVYDTQVIDYKHKLVIFFDNETQCTYTRLFNEIEFMENTGLKDKHGDYVYVGSILTDEGILGDDYWDYATIEKDINEGYCISWENNEFSESLDECSAYSVVGNIYEHKELLKNE